MPCVDMCVPMCVPMCAVRALNIAMTCCVLLLRLLSLVIGVGFGLVSLPGLLLCGCLKGGEYETLTLDCPLYKRRIVLEQTEVVGDKSNDGVWPATVDFLLNFFVVPPYLSSILSICILFFALIFCLPSFCCLL